MQNMNWDDIRYFLAIAESGSLAKAATRLGVNHSTVFRRLEAFEETLSSRLFDRLKEGYKLTPAGERLLVLAREADGAMQKVQLEIAGQDIALSGSVCVTTPANIARTIAPSVIASLREDHPDITLEIITSDNDFDLNRREADIALRATNNPPEHLIGRYLVTLGWWVCATPELRKQYKKDPKTVPFIGADQTMQRREAYQWLEREHGDQIVTRANDINTMAALAIEGIGCAVLPEDQRHDELEKLFRLPSVMNQLWLLSHPDLKAVRRVKVVWDALANAVRAEYG